MTSPDIEKLVRDLQKEVNELKEWRKEAEERQKHRPCMHVGYWLNQRNASGGKVGIGGGTNG